VGKITWRSREEEGEAGIRRDEPEKPGESDNF